MNILTKIHRRRGDEITLSAAKKQVMYFRKPAIKTC